MKLHELKPAPGSRRPRKRVGRGIAAGQGKPPAGGPRGRKPVREAASAPALKGDKTRCTAVCRSAVSPTRTARSTR